ncbi:helix-turn-helix domain-containing protein [Prosthecomicrobium hirschii]|uniref:helix-turn-helix domain-containing protein n=1 Tax=Prosthecodimorpha hirschii TaxID=665126 RepID=UPI003B8A6EC0
MVVTMETDRGKILRLEFGKRLRAVRHLRGFKTGDELANAIGIRPEAYRRYERGEAAPQIDTLESLRRVLCVSADWLFFGDASIKGTPNLPKN